MTRKAKWGIGCGGLLLIVIVLIVILAAKAGGGASEVRVEAVQRRDLVETVTANGWIRPHRSVDVQSDVMGRIVSLNVKEGDRVERGQLLLRIDPAQYEAAVARARGAVSESLAREAQARAGVLQAQQALDRAKALRARDAALISDEALEQAQTQAKVQDALLEAARYGVEQARAALREAEDQQGKTVIRAPIAGVVTRLNVDEGETAIVGMMNNPGSLLLTISDLETMEAVVQVDETDVPRIHLGDTATVEIDAFPRQKFAGTVTEIGHSAVRAPKDAQAVGQNVEIDFEVVVTLAAPPSALRPDLSATADIVTATRDDALSIPIVALTVRERPKEPVPSEDADARAASEAAVGGPQDQEGVFVIREGKAHFTPVEIGISGGEHFEVLTGLEEGDTVASGPYEVVRSLEDGQDVQIEGAGDERKGGAPAREQAEAADE